MTTSAASEPKRRGDALEGRLVLLEVGFHSAGRIARVGWWQLAVGSWQLAVGSLLASRPTANGQRPTANCYGQLLAKRQHIRRRFALHRQPQLRRLERHGLDLCGGGELFAAAGHALHLLPL